MVVRPHLQRLVERIRMRPPLRAAFVFPCDRDSLQLALSGSFAGYLAPVLVNRRRGCATSPTGPASTFRGLELVDTADDARAAGLRAGGAGARRTGTGAGQGQPQQRGAERSGRGTRVGGCAPRRQAVPRGLPRPAGTRVGPAAFADAQLNVTPNLAAKRDILQTSATSPSRWDWPAPAVALLAATDVESPAFPSTRDAIALKLMAPPGAARRRDRRRPDDARQRAVGRRDARRRRHIPETAGRADVLLAPSMEAATMVLRTLLALTSRPPPGWCWGPG